MSKFGRSVAIDSTSTHAIVGDDGRGKAGVFGRPNPSTALGWQETQLVTETPTASPTIDDEFGWDVQMNSDYVVVGASGYDNTGPAPIRTGWVENSGISGTIRAAYVFYRNPITGWSHNTADQGSAQLLGTSFSRSFGHAVAITPDSTFIFVTSPEIATFSIFTRKLDRINWNADPMVQDKPVARNAEQPYCKWSGAGDEFMHFGYAIDATNTDVIVGANAQPFDNFADKYNCAFVVRSFYCILFLSFNCILLSSCRCSSLHILPPPSPPGTEVPTHCAKQPVGN